MTKEEIQAEAEKYAEGKSSNPVFKAAHMIDYTNGVLSETARKHWEPKWIKSDERLPTNTDRDELGEVFAKDYHGFTKVVTWIELESNKKRYPLWMPIPAFNQ